MLGRRLAAMTLALVVCAGCASTADPTDEPAPAPTATASPSRPPSATPDPSASPSPSPPLTYSTYPLGERVLPLRPDGFGEVRPTPPTLRDRRYPTADVLPPPSDGRFVATVDPVTPAVRDRMGETWTPQCPVALADLRYLTVSFRGFDGEAHTGELVVAAQEAENIVAVFRRLFGAGFPIEEMRLPTTADLDAPPTGDGNNTAGLVCRPSTGLSTWSAHAYGMAIDLNPFQNPYQRDDVVLPELASSYLDRDRVRDGMVRPGDVAVRAFAAVGWSWGGDWSSLKDYQHFSPLDR